jgi:hypothetical protein
MASGPGVTIDAEIFLRALTTLRPPRLNRPVALALVDTAKSAISRAGSAIAKQTGLKSAVARSRMNYDPVREGDRQVVIRASRKPIPLGEFPGVRQAAGGVRVRVWGRPQVLAGAFIATMPNGYTGPFRRTGAYGRRGKPYLERIQKLWGPTIRGTFVTPEVKKIISETAKTRLRATLVRRIAAEMRRRR